MIHSDVLKEQFRVAHWVLTHQTRGLSQAELLRQLAGRDDAVIR